MRFASLPQEKMSRARIGIHSKRFFEDARGFGGGPWARRKRPRNSTGRAAFGSASTARRNERSASSGFPSSIHALRPRPTPPRRRGMEDAFECVKKRASARRPQPARRATSTRGPERVDEERGPDARKEGEWRDDRHPVAQPGQGREVGGDPRDAGVPRPGGAAAGARTGVAHRAHGRRSVDAPCETVRSRPDGPTG